MRRLRVRSRFALVFAALMLVLVLSGCAQVRARIAAVQHSAASPAVVAGSAAVENHVTATVNALRAAHHLRTLALSPNLVSKARYWSMWMALGNCGGPAVCHSSLTGGIAVHWRWLAENVGAARPRSDVDAIVSGFAHSPDHLANILSTRATNVGIGVAYSGNTVYVVEEFMQAA